VPGLWCSIPVKSGPFRLTGFGCNCEFCSVIPVWFLVPTVVIVEFGVCFPPLFALLGPASPPGEMFGVPVLLWFCSAPFALLGPAPPPGEVFGVLELLFVSGVCVPFKSLLPFCSVHAALTSCLPPGPGIIASDRFLSASAENVRRRLCTWPPIVSIVLSLCMPLVLIICWRLIGTRPVKKKGSFITCFVPSAAS